MGNDPSACSTIRTAAEDGRDMSPGRPGGVATQQAGDAVALERPKISWPPTQPAIQQFPWPRSGGQKGKMSLALPHLLDSYQRSKAKSEGPIKTCACRRNGHSTFAHNVAISSERPFPLYFSRVMWEVCNPS